MEGKILDDFIFEADDAYLEFFLDETDSQSDYNDSDSDSDWEDGDGFTNEDFVGNEGSGSKHDEENNLENIPPSKKRKKDANTPVECPSGWNSEFTRFQQEEPFFDNPGPQTQLPSHASAHDYLELFFTPYLLQKIAAETNLHALRVIRGIKNASTKQRLLKEWYSLEIDELKGFLATIIYAGLVKMGNWEDYFQHSDLGQPFVKTSFTQRRWTLIKRFLHFESDDIYTSQNQRHKLSKIWTVYSYLKIRCKMFWRPGK